MPPEMLPEPEPLSKGESSVLFIASEVSALVSLTLANMVLFRVF